MQVCCRHYLRVYSCHSPVSSADAASSVQCEESLYVERINPVQRRGWYPSLLDEADYKVTEHPIDGKPAAELLDGTCCHSYGIRGYVDQTSVIPQATCQVAVNYGKHVDCGCIAGSMAASSGYISRGPYGTLSTTVVDFGGPVPTLLRRTADQPTSNRRNSVASSSKSSTFHVIGNSRQQQVSTQLLREQQSPGVVVGSTIQQTLDYNSSFNV